MISKEEYIIKNKRMEVLLKKISDEKPLPTKLMKELDKISDEIADYEEKYFPFKPDNLVEMIELRMYERKLKQKDLADLLETSPSRVSELLSGKRNLTFDLAKKIHLKLNIDAELILSA